jgi:hypothetical protein
MDGIGKLGIRNEERSYCGNDDGVEPEPVCRAPQETPASDALVCSLTTADVATPTEAPSGAGNEARRAQATGGAREADYFTLSVGIGAVIGLSASATFDRHGHVYLGLAGGVGLRPAITASLVAGHMVDPPSPTEKDLRGLLAGDAVNLSAGAIRGTGITNSPGGTAIEEGIYVPQAVFAFEHNWDVSSKGPRW